MRRADGEYGTTVQPGTGQPGPERTGSRSQRHQNRPHRTSRRLFKVIGAVVAAVAIAAGVVIYNHSSSQPKQLPVHLPAAADGYLGVYAQGAPLSYSGVTAFRKATGTSPDLAMYYSGWYESFQTTFVRQAAADGEVPLVQIDPGGISLASIASGKYDGYLSSYAVAVKAYHGPIVIGFGHEMNGSWSSWGYTHTSPKTFVAAWQHIVKVFRALGATNVTWMWTVNIINDTQQGKIPSPTAWWPGSAYVNWVGIDGYYLKSNWQFAPLFGPTIAAVRELTSAPILIGETGVVPQAGQAAKVADAFAGVKAYGLLGLVYFDSTDKQKGQPFGLQGAAASTAFGKAASDYHRPGS
jgi:mannan endo-1,4-beta-mannosidase